MVNIVCDRCKKNINNEEEIGVISMVMRSSLFSNADKRTIGNCRDKHFCDSCMEVFSSAFDKCFSNIKDKVKLEEEDTKDETHSSDIEEKPTDKPLYTVVASLTNEVKVESEDKKNSEDVEIHHPTHKGTETYQYMGNTHHNGSSGVMGIPFKSGTSGSNGKKGKPRTITDEVIYTMIKYSDRGNSKNQISNRVNYSYSTVNSYLTMGIAARDLEVEKIKTEYPELNRLDFPKIFQLVSLGWKVEDIAREMSISEERAKILAYRLTHFKILGTEVDKKIF